MIGEELKTPETAWKSDRQLLEEVHEALQEVRVVIAAVKRNPAARSFLGIKE